MAKAPPIAQRRRRAKTHRLQPICCIVDWAICFTDNVRPPFRMSKHIAQKIPVGILGVTQETRSRAARLQTRGKRSHHDGRETQHEEVRIEEAGGIRRRRRPGRRCAGRLLRLELRQLVERKLRRQDHHGCRKPHAARGNPQQRRGRSAQGAGLHAEREGIHRLYPAEHGHRGRRS